MSHARALPGPRAMLLNKRKVQVKPIPGRTCGCDLGRSSVRAADIMARGIYSRQGELALDLGLPFFFVLF